MGVVLNEIQSRDSQEPEPNSCSNNEDFDNGNKCEKLMAFFQKVKKESDIFGKYPDINRIMEIQVVAVNEAFKGKGLCTALFDKAKYVYLYNVL